MTAPTILEVPTRTPSPDGRCGSCRHWDRHDEGRERRMNWNCLRGRHRLAPPFMAWFLPGLPDQIDYVLCCCVICNAVLRRPATPADVLIAIQEGLPRTDGEKRDPTQYTISGRRVRIFKRTPQFEAELVGSCVEGSHLVKR